MNIHPGRGLHGTVVETLGRRILAGQIAEGETLDPGRLGEDFTVSRTVVREALQTLKAKGLVDARQKRGTFVQARSHWNLLDLDLVRWQFEGGENSGLLQDLSEVRGMLEPACARLAALRRTPQDLLALEEALDAMSRAAQGDGDAVAADLSFHRAVLTATHNEMVVRVEVVLSAGLAARDTLVHGAVQDDDPTPAHAAVAEAIEQRDPDAAERATQALLAKSLRDMERARDSHAGTPADEEQVAR
jgi:GntR family galactonate operon transcriptional repressor